MGPLGHRRGPGPFAAAAELERGLAHGATDPARAERAFALGRGLGGHAPGLVAAAWAQRVALLVDSALAGADPDQRALVDALIRSGGADLGAVLDGAARARRDGVRERVHALSGNLAEVSSAMTMHGGSLEYTLEKESAASAEQAAAVAEVTSSLSELRQTSAQALDQAQGLLQVSERAGRDAARGAEVVAGSVDGMGAIRERVEAIQEKILALSDHTQQIGDIISTVNEIAEQSKLLALNASIEAARAGESGRSFSVVANEMRDLAEQSKQATRQVRQLLNDIREATGAAVVATEDGIQKVDHGHRLAQEAGGIIRDLTGVIDQSVEASRLIANASRQQGAGVTQVADAMVNIDQALRGAGPRMASLRELARELSGAAHTLSDALTEAEAVEAALG